jgi:hypothetical protein
VRCDGVSLRHNQRIRATQIGLVVTIVALAAMEVYAREVIHKAKCAPRKIPASTAYRSAPGLRLVFRIPHQAGNRTSDATERRTVARSKPRPTEPLPSAA